MADTNSTLITLSNPRTTLNLAPAHPATHAREGQVAGDVYDQSEALAARDRGEKAPYIFGGEQHNLLRYAVGALVLIPSEIDTVYGAQVVTGDKWECFCVESNPAYEASEPSEGVRVVSFDDFNVRRHGAE